jgi:activator of HSP90 ATPase
MKTIKQSYQIKATIDKVWQALVDPEIIDKWGAGPCQMDDKVGTNFKLWDVDIFGKNIKVENLEGNGKKLVQEWFAGNWEKPSIVTFALTAQNGQTKIDLVHQNIPDDEAEEIDDGWNRYYFGEIKKLLETKS